MKKYLVNFIKIWLVGRVKKESETYSCDNNFSDSKRVDEKKGNMLERKELLFQKLMESNHNSSVLRELYHRREIARKFSSSSLLFSVSPSRLLVFFSQIRLHTDLSVFIIIFLFIFFCLLSYCVGPNGNGIASQCSQCSFSLWFGYGRSCAMLKRL